MSTFLDESVRDYKKITRYYALFNLIFFCVAFLEIFFFLLFFSFFSKSAFLGISIGSIFFTGFSYFVLLFYFQGKKPEQLLSIKENYIASYKKEIDAVPETAEYHFALIEGIYQLINALQNQESTFYKLPPSFETLGPLLEKFSVWTFWKEVQQMKEMLLLEIIQEHLKLVRKEATYLKTHISLAKAYQALASLYPHSDVEQKFTHYMEKCLEELKIIAHFAPQNSWVHSELAATYYALKRPEQELAAYETLRQLSPGDKELLLQLGTRYFQQNRSAQGLIIYEELKEIDPSHAAQLISHY